MSLSLYSYFIEDSSRIITYLQSLRTVIHMKRGSYLFEPNTFISENQSNNEDDSPQIVSPLTQKFEIENLNKLDVQPLLNQLYSYYEQSLSHESHNTYFYEAMIYLVVELIAKYKAIEYVRNNSLKLTEKVTRSWNSKAFNLLVSCFTKCVEKSSFESISQSHVLHSSRFSLYIHSNLTNVIAYVQELINNLNQISSNQEKLFAVKRIYVTLQLVANIAFKFEREKSLKLIHNNWNGLSNLIESFINVSIELGSLSEYRLHENLTSSFVDILRIIPEQQTRDNILKSISSSAQTNWDSTKFLVISTLKNLHKTPIDDFVLLNLIDFVNPLISFITYIFKSKIDEERSIGIQIFSNFNIFIKSLSHHETLLYSFTTEILKVGIELLTPGVLVGDSKREALFGLSRLDHKIETSDLKTKLISLFIEILQSQTESESTQSQAASTLATWWISSDSTLDESSLSFMKQFITNLDKLTLQTRKEILYGLGAISEHNESFITNNMKSFFDIVSVSEAKIAERPSAVQALRVLIRSSISSKKVAGQLPGNNIFKKVLGGTNPYLVDSQTLNERYHLTKDIHGSDDFDALTDSILISLKNYVNHLKLKECKQLFITLASLLCNTYSWKATRRIISDFESGIGTNPQIRSLIFEGFIDYLRSIKASDISPEKRYSLSTAFLVLAPKITIETNATEIAKTIQLAHHPLFILNPNDYGKYGKQERYWTTYEKLIKLNASLRKIIHQNLDDILSYLVSSQGIGSNIEYESKASSYAISSLISKKDCEKILTQIGESLQKNFEIHSSFSKEDFAIFLTNPNEVHRDLDDEIESNPIFYNIPEHKRNKYSLSRQEWEKILKDEQEIKKKNPAMDLKEIKISLLKKIYLVKESKLRSQIQDLYSKIMALLEVTISISKNPKNSKFLQESISLVSLYVSDFISSPIDSLAKKSFESFQSLAIATFENRQSLAYMITNLTYRLIRQFNDETKINGVDNDSFFTEHVIAEIRKAGMLTAEQFSILIPFLKIVLSKVGIDQGLRLNQVTLSQAMSILGTHSGLSGIRSRIVRSRIIDIVVDVQNYHSTLNKAAKSTLLSGAPHMLPADIFPLLEGILSLNDKVRLSVLDTLSHFAPLMTNSLVYEDRKETFHPSNPLMLSRLYLAIHDESSQCSELAQSCWNNYWKNINENPTNATYVEIQNQILPLLRNSDEFVRQIASKSIGSLLNKLGEKSLKTKLISEIISIYDSDLSIEELNGRLGTALALSYCGNGSEFSHLETIFDLIINKGFKDPNSEVCNLFATSGEKVIRDTSDGNKKDLSNLFEKYLKKLENIRVRSQKEQEQLDFATGNLAVYLGTVARYADYTQAQVKDIVQKLVQTLSIHSNVVQNSVSNALSYLVIKMNSDDVDQIIVSLIDSCSKGDYGDRRGAAFGIAGLMKGLGISGIRECNLMARINSLIRKASPEALEGSMQIYELLSKKLEELFDPYLPEILPNILTCISDLSRDVCDSADQCASEVMKHITPHSARMVLPDILQNMKLEVGQKVAWRKRQAAVSLLGAMAYSAPRMLSSYLPTIVNILKDGLVEVHEGVSSAAKKALERVGAQVENPEIKHQIPDLLKALGEPTEKSNDILDSLLFTRFTHSIDPCSLALLMPVLERALTHRDQNLKKKAGQIIGSVASLVNDPTVVTPYLSTILPLLHELLIDHQPRVRKSAAKSIGTLTKTLGENRLQDIIDWIHATLQNPNSGLVERHGCSQAVAEICSSQGISKLKETIPKLVEFSKSQYANVRMGYIQVFVYLPEIVQQDFCVVLPDCMPRVLQGISDVDDDVSNVSFGASQLMIRMFADSAIPMVLPALEQGMQEFEWRTRHASVILLGDFLQRISDTNKPSTVHLRGDQTIHIDTIYNRIEEKHVHLLLSLLYLLHSDSTANVRTEAHRVWRSIISHSPKALRTIMPTLIDILIEHLSHIDEEKRQTGARCIGELVGRMGDSVTNDLIPLLSERLQSPNPLTRQGVCIGLTELMQAAPNKAIIPYVGKLLPAIQRAVSDTDSTVQDAASHSFHALISVAGGDSVVQVVNAMLKDLHDTNIEKQQIAMIGLQKLVKTSGDRILSTLIPAVVKSDSPILDANAETLASVFNVSGPHLIPYLHIYDKILSQAGEVRVPKIYDSFNSYPIVKALHGFLKNSHDIAIALDTITEKIKTILLSNHSNIRLGACFSVQLICLDINPKSVLANERAKYLQPLIPNIVRLFIDPDPIIVEASWHAFNNLLDSIPKADQSDFISTITSSIIDFSQDERGNRSIDLVPAFNLPNGLDPFIKLFLEGVTSGKTAEIREHAADGICACIKLTSEKNFEPYVLKLGPLIRIASNKLPWLVKAAILKCIVLLLEKGGKKAKPFIPSMQTTFVKSLTSSHSVIRNLSADALGILVVHGARIKSLVTELMSALKALEIGRHLLDVQSHGIFISLSNAIENIMAVKGREIKDKQILEIVDYFLLIIHLCNDSRIRKCCSNAFGACIGQSDLTHTSIQFADKRVEAFAVIGMAKHCPAKIDIESTLDSLYNIIDTENIEDRRCLAVECTVEVLLHSAVEDWNPFLKILINEMEGSSLTNKIFTVKLLKKLAKNTPKPELLYPVASSIARLSKERNSVLKENLEWATLYIFSLYGGNTKEVQAFFVKNKELSGDQVEILREYTKKVASKLGNETEISSEDEEEDYD